MQTIVVIPTFNERENLGPLVASILALEPPLDILVVDDNSPDGTGDLADEMARADQRVHVLHRPSKQGLGPAYRDGFRFALANGFSHVVEMDADGSHRPEDLPRLLSASASADLVIGSRNVAGGRAENWSWIRHVVSKGGSLYTRLVLGLPIRDCTSGFKCFRATVLESIPLGQVTANGYGFQVEMNWLTHRFGFRIAEVPIVFPNRRRGTSKMSMRIVAEALLLVLRLRLSDPTRSTSSSAATDAPVVGLGTES
jgi:dolichol-phosphate mannosyltransferase